MNAQKIADALERGEAQQVAKAAGVTPATVSRVLNGSPKVSTAYVVKVLEAATSVINARKQRLKMTQQVLLHALK